MRLEKAAGLYLGCDPMGFLRSLLFSLRVSLFPFFFRSPPPSFNRPPVQSQGHGNDMMFRLMHLNSGMELDAVASFSEILAFVC